MPEVVKTAKILLLTDNDSEAQFMEMTGLYADACTYVSQWVFDNGFPLNSNKVQEKLYSCVRERFLLKSQLAVSVFKTVTARYKTVREQLWQNPYVYEDESGRKQYITRTLEWLQKPVVFSRPQADLVRNRDYSFIENGLRISVNTLGSRVKLRYHIPDNFMELFDGSWTLGTAKLVSLNGLWYMHIPASKQFPDSEAETNPAHVVGIDRGLRFLTTTYDETGKCSFSDGKSVLKKRNIFRKVRAELQARGTKSAKRKLKSISGRENRWMADVNHQLSKTLVDGYGNNTLYVLEDLTGVSFDEDNLSHRNREQRNEVRSWAFYQFEQFLTYKAAATGSKVIKVAADYTSQRCPKCGRIHKPNRNHDIHEYICDACGYRSNDDRVGAMNIHILGTMYVSGDTNPRFGSRKS